MPPPPPPGSSPATLRFYYDALRNRMHARQQRPPQPRVLVLFSGPYARADSLQAWLENLGFDVTAVDNDPTHGDAAHDFRDNKFYAELLERVRDGHYFAVFAAPPCSTFSVSRHYRVKRRRSSDTGPPPVRTRRLPRGLLPPPPGHAAELANANDIIDRLCNLLTAAADAGTEFIVENPADRGDMRNERAFLTAEHCPVWLYPAMVKLRGHASCELSTFHQCAFGAPFQKATTLMFTQGMAPYLGPWQAELQCTHASHKEQAGGARDSSGVWHSRRTAAYPAAMNRDLAAAIQRSFLVVCATPPSPPHDAAQPPHADEHPDAAYVECPHGFVHVTGPVDSSMQPVCTLTECVCDALDWCWDTLKPTPPTPPKPPPCTEPQPYAPPPSTKRKRDATPPAEPQAGPSPFTYVIPISVDAQLLACVPAGGGLFRADITGVNGIARKSATASAASLIPTLTCGVSADAVFLAGQLHGEHITVGACNAPQAALNVCTTRAQMLARKLELGELAPIWCTLDALAEGLDTGSDVDDNATQGHTYLAAASAIARTLSHAGPAATTLTQHLRIGADAGGTVSRNAAASAGRTSFQDRYERAVSADAELQRELLNAASSCGDPSLAATFTAWADRFSPPPLDEIPHGLRQQAADFSTCAHLADTPFRQRCQVPQTDGLPPPAPQPPCTDGWQPASLEDVLTPDAISRVRSALRRVQAWHSAKVAGRDAPRPPTVALGSSAFQPRARGRIWDLRGCRADGSGAPKLLDTTTPPFDSHLNVDFLEQLFAESADKELLSMLRFGVCVHAELEPQIVIMPNLLSLYDGSSGITEAARTVSELTGMGWWQQHDFIPFAPWRCAPRGAVPRKDGGAARGIVDQGAPRTDVRTRPEQEHVTSLNEACRRGRERREVKPRFADLAHNASVLLHIADSIGEPTFTVAFDFSKYFHQLWFQSAELWRMGSLLPLADADGAASDLISIHTEMVMSMGLTPSSEIAQRLGNMLMQVFSSRLRAAEAKHGLARSDTEAAWRSRRAAMPADILGSQDRLFDAMQYTDDPVFTIVGVQRTILAITVWHQIITGSGLMPAKFSKWQIGAGVHWLGGCCYPSLGVMWVPRDKAMRTRARIQTVLDGVCTPTTYRELVGFLEHVTDIGQFPRELMQHLHHPMRAGGECELDPHGKLQPDGRRDGYLRKWRSILLNTPGSSILSAVQHMPLDPTAHAVWRLRSDAMLEPYGSAMGGCLYGTWWRFPLIRPELTIPVLELLAACVNFLIFADQLSHARQVVMEIDALASPIALTKDKARSPGLRAVLAEFRRLPALQPFVNDGRLFCAHCWGEGNPLGDAASRGKLEVISAIGSALGMHMQQVAMGSEAIAFINRVLARLQSQPLTTAEIEFDSTLGYPGEGPPDEMPSRSSSPPSCHTPAPAQASPTLLAFLTESEQRADTFHPSASSPLSRPVFPAAPPSPPVTAADGSPLSTFASPPPVHPASHHPSPPSPSPVETAFATADAWCPSLLPAPAEMQSAEEHHRAFAAAQCAHVAAETSAPSLLLQLAEAHINTRPHPPPPAALAVSSAASWTGSSAANTMSIAATARAQALTAALASSAANGGIRLDEGEADELACRLVTLLESAAAANTLKGERSNWKHWLAFCTHRNIAPMRPDVRGMTHGEYDSEVVYLALGLLFVHGRMGCRRGRSKPPRPSSALAVLRGIRRAHARLGIQMADLSLATRLADALNKEYIAAHGWEALNVNRVAPLTNAIIQGMIAAPCISDSSLQSVSTRAMWATLAQTGFRKAEVATDSAAAFGKGSLTRHNLRWRINGIETADPTAEQLKGMREGDLAILIPPKSKCDQFGLEWGQAPIYLRYHVSSAVCAARALRDLELRHPRHGLTQRETTALFVRDNGLPLSTANVDKLFKECLAGSGIPRSAQATYSPHSFRRYLACALKAQGASDSTIQALLRWKTAESLKLYAILNDESYADLVDSAGSADVSSVRTNALPRAELLDAADSFDKCRASLSTAAKEAQSMDPSEDVYQPDSEIEASSNDEDDDGAAAAPRPLQRTRKRSADASTSAPGPTVAPPVPLTTIDSAKGLRALVPAVLWPSYPCAENSGKGWDVDIVDVDKRVNAVLVSFAVARDASGKRWAREWLTFESLQSL